jgi:hypothetical protein
MEFYVYIYSKMRIIVFYDENDIYRMSMTIMTKLFLEVAPP